MADLVVAMLQFVVLLLTVALLPIALAVSTPLVLLWPTNGMPYGVVIKLRYWSVCKAVFFVWELVGSAML